MNWFSRAGWRHQSASVELASVEAGRANQNANHAIEEIHKLKNEMTQLRQLCGAMWELLKTTQGFSEEDLKAALKNTHSHNEAPPLSADSAKVIHCDSCGRTINVRKEKCLYCGAENKSFKAFG